MDERLRELNEELSELNGRLARANGLERRLDDLRAQYKERMQVFHTQCLYA